MPNTCNYCLGLGGIPLILDGITLGSVCATTTQGKEPSNNANPRNIPKIFSLFIVNLLLKLEDLSDDISFLKLSGLQNRLQDIGYSRKGLSC